jgi:hypothetical protein
VIRPLTYHSSLKYGASTKWCTVSDKNPDYFLRYTKRGILLYMINKVTGLKVACFKSLDSEPEFSFWNQVDTRIDSLESGLPLFIIDVIRDEVTNSPITNMSLLSDEDRKTQENLVRSKLKSIEHSNDVSIADMRDMGLEPNILRNYENEPIMDARDEDMETERVDGHETYRTWNDGIQQEPEPETVGDVRRIDIL